MMRFLVVLIVALAALATNASAHHCKGNHKAQLGCQSPTPTPTPTPTATATPAPSPAALFKDDFNGSPGAPPDPAKWVDQNILGTNSACPNYMGQSCHKSSNVFQDGAGHLVLRAQREPSGYMGYQYSGAQIATFLYGWGWPAPAQYNRFLVAPPYRVDVRSRWPRLPGGYGTVPWMHTADRSRSQLIYEFDLADNRTSVPNDHLCAYHEWLEGSDQRFATGHLPVNLLEWHTYTVEARLDSTKFYVDGMHCLTTWGTQSNQGLMMNWGVAKPNLWYSAYGSTPGVHQPDPADPGPWDVLVDSVVVTRLSN
jgi:hypothetical protein